MKTPSPTDGNITQTESTTDGGLITINSGGAVEEAENPVPIETGSICDLKELFKGRETCSCCITWFPEPQKDLPTTATDEIAGYAILTRKTEGHGDFGRQQKLHSIVIQSPLIRDVLEPILKEYPGITSELSSMTIDAPFACFYHRWAELKAAFKLCTGEKAEHMGLLMTLLTAEFDGIQKAMSDLLRNNVIEHKYLWALFNPGDVLITKLQGQDAAVIMEDGVEYDDTPDGEPGYALLCRHIEYNGCSTGFLSTTIKIPEFKGSKPLSYLPAVPLRTREDKEQLTEKLVSGGKRFAELRNATFQEYSGVAFLTGPRDPNHPNNGDDQRIQVQLTGRVMVDAYACFQFLPTERIYLRPLTVTNPINRLHQNGMNRVHMPGVHMRPPGPPPPMIPPPGRFGHRGMPMPRPPPNINSRGGVEIWDAQSGHMIQETKGRPKESDQVKLTEEQLLICAPFVRGYSFKIKKWVLLNIKDLVPVTWTEDMFDNLVLPQQEKQLLLALTRSHAKQNLKFDDFVVGKGKGIIMMLDGPPGTGKTLTAEGVAEAMKAPLYTMSAGELGLDTRQVEKKLSDVLEMATMWNAILLIDEADIFLEQREPQQLMRNELVSIFLRHLEYFKGVMILTTNRVGAIDLAFDSRVDIRLHYPELDSVARRKVWYNFANKLPSGSSLEDEELDKLAEVDLNGRQIKSAMKTAYLLASGNDENVNFEHVQSVLRITRDVLV